MKNLDKTRREDDQKKATGLAEDNQSHEADPENNGFDDAGSSEVEGKDIDDDDSFDSQDKSRNASAAKRQNLNKPK